MAPSLPLGKTSLAGNRHDSCAGRLSVKTSGLWVQQLAKRNRWLDAVALGRLPWFFGKPGYRFDLHWFTYPSAFAHVGRSHSTSGTSSRYPRSGESRCEPHAGHWSGTPRICRITAEVARPIAFSVTEKPASASCHLDPLVCVSQLANFHALSSRVLKRWRRFSCAEPGIVTGADVISPSPHVGLLRSFFR